MTVDHFVKARGFTVGRFACRQRVIEVVGDVLSKGQQVGLLACLQLRNLTILLCKIVHFASHARYRTRPAHRSGAVIE